MVEALKGQNPIVFVPIYYYFYCNFLDFLINLFMPTAQTAVSWKELETWNLAQ